ncbi:hypothetical protein ElyMa_003559300 [Elysia marginata]|uniref:Uncharacterized protein n=1 Tax=Elysia marginata TaxID=1093978 RepID=A0AAV4EL43_9GAST|nr:hypothetical protein ElyMa_003559300 [Elysia marginata]
MTPQPRMGGPPMARGGPMMMGGPGNMRPQMPRGPPMPVMRGNYCQVYVKLPWVGVCQQWPACRPIKVSGHGLRA